MKLIRWLTIILAIPVSSVAQLQYDSLIQALHGSRKEGNVKGEVLACSHLGYFFWQTEHYDSALRYYHRVLKYPQWSLNPEIDASSKNALGVVYSLLRLSDSSIYYYQEAWKAYKLLKDTTRSTIIESNLSILYKDIGQYEKALDYAFMALTTLEKKQPDRSLASCYNTLGLIYKKIGNKDLALKYAWQALTVRKKLGFTKGIGQSYNNIGEIHLHFDQYDSALVNLYKSLEIKKNAESKSSWISTMNNIGLALMELSRFSEAEQYFMESLAINREFPDKLLEVVALNNLAELKWKNKEVSSALTYLSKAEKIIRELGLLRELKDNLELKFLISKTIGNYSLALESSQELLAVKDSLLSQDKMESLMSMQARYESQKKEQQIELLEKSNQVHQARLEVNRIWIRVLVTSTVVLVAIAIFVYYMLRSVRRNKLKVEILLKELHHRVKNNLQILSSVLSLQSREVSDQNALHLVKSSESRVNAMALIHRKLYTTDQNREINIKEYVTELVTYLVHTYGYANKELNVKLELEEIYVDVDKAIPLGLIINELVSNSFKYAYEHSPHPELHVEVIRHPQSLYVQVSDNGKGMPMPAQKSPSQSFGLKMVGILIKELKGKWETRVDNGTSFALHIPLVQ